MSDIKVTLSADDEITPAATKAAGATDKLNSQETKLGKVQDKISKSEKLADSASEKAARHRRSENREQTETVKHLLEGHVSEALHLGGVAFAAGAAAGAVIGIGIAAGVALGGIAALALKADAARESAKGILDVLTAGRGDSTLALVDQEATSLGVNLNTARDSFIKFRQAGASNDVSANLLKLQADLNQVDSTGKLAAEATSKVLAGPKNAQGVLLVSRANAEMALLAKQAGVAGDGAKSAAARFTTLAGATASLDNSKTQALEAIGEKIGPTIDAAASKAAKFVDAFLNSAQGQAAIQGISDAITGFVADAEKAVDLASSFVTTIQKYTPVLKAVAVGAAAAGAVFLATVVPAFVATGIAAAAAAIPVIAAAAPFIAVGVAAAGVYYAFTHLSEIFGVVEKAFGDIGSEAESLGGDLVTGIINGVTGAAGALYGRVKDLASGAVDSFKSVLGIHSPSTVFAGLGNFAGQGFGKGLEAGAPDSSAVASAVLPEPTAIAAATKDAGAASVQASQGAAAPKGPFGSGASAGAADGAAAGGGAVSVTIGEITITVPGGDAGEIGRSVRRELQRSLSGLTLSRGVT